MEELNLKALLADESFINYCKGYPAQDVDKWEQWLQDHPQYRKKSRRTEKASAAYGSSCRRNYR